MKRFLKAFLPSKLYAIGKWTVEYFRIAKTLIIYKLRNRSPSVIFWLADSGSIGGTELQIRLIAQQIDDCLLILSGRAEEGEANLFLQQLKKAKIPFISLGKWGLIRAFSSHLTTQLAARLLRWIAPEGKICHFFNPASTRFIPVAKVADFRIFYMETGLPKRDQGWEILDQMAPYFDHVTAVSQVSLNRLKELFFYQGPSTLIPSMITPFPRAPNAQKTLHIAYFGRLTPIKRIDSLIRAFSSLVEQFPEAKLSIIGMGELFSSLKEQIGTLPIQMPGRLEPKELSAYLIGVDLICLPSETEGLPSSLLEAMSMGLPIIATRVGGIPEIIEHGVNGLLIPPHDDEALKKALFQLASNPCLRREMGKAGFARFQKLRSKEAIIATLKALYAS